LQAVQQSSSSEVHKVGITESSLIAASTYTFTVQEEICWLHQIMTDPRLLQGFKNLCQQVTAGQSPYAPLLALNYQLGGRFNFPTPEAWAVVVL
jgi:hypothetical protein